MIYPPNQKPPIWSIDPGVIAYNCQKAGMPHPVLAMPMWAGAGNRAMDYSGHGNHGIIGSSLNWGTDINGMGIKGNTTYNDANNVINCGSSIDPTSWSGITIVARAEVVAPGAEEYPSIVNNMENGEYYDNFNFSYERLSSGAWYRARWRPGQNSSALEYNFAVPYTGFIDLAATWVRQGTAKIFRDGLVVSSGAKNLDWDVTNYTTYINGYFRSTWRTSENHYYHILIYNTALSESQVKFLHDDSYFMYQIPEELYGYAAAAGISIPLLMQQMNQFDGGTYALC